MRHAIALTAVGPGCLALVGLLLACLPGCGPADGGRAEADPPRLADSAPSPSDSRQADVRPAPRRLPAGFVAIEGAPTDPSGWPKEIRCLKDESVMVLVPAGRTQTGLSDAQVRMLAKLEGPDSPAPVPMSATARPGKLLTKEDVAAANSPDRGDVLGIVLLEWLQEEGAEIPAADLATWRKQDRSAEALLAIESVRGQVSQIATKLFQAAPDKGAMEDTIKVVQARPGNVLNDEDLRALREGDAGQRAGVLLLSMLSRGEKPEIAASLRQWRESGRTVRAGLDSPVLRAALIREARTLVLGLPEAEIREMFPEPRTAQLSAFYIDKYEVTNRQYRAFFSQAKDPDRKPGKWYGPSYNISAKPTKFYDLWGDPQRNADDQPVTCVGEKDVRTYAAWTGKSLPTRDEWERAARGDGDRLFPWGEDLKGGCCACDIHPPPQPATQKAAEGGPTIGATIEFLRAARQEWRKLRDGIPPAKVGQFPRDVSPYGCHDMAGNVSEWVVEPKAADKESLTTMGGNVESFLPRYVCPATKATTEAGRLLGFRTILRLDAPREGR